MKHTSRAVLLSTSVTALMSYGASAQVIIDNGTVQLGINPAGNLVDTSNQIGLTFLNTTASSGEALAPGCECEGWGIADLDTGEFAKAGETFGFSNIAASNVTATGTGTDPLSFGNAATSVTDVADGALSLQITHDFKPSASDNLYEVDVMIENTAAGAVGDLVYRRAMDWDIPDTEFNEFVTIGGWPAANLIGSSDDGFVDGNPNVPLTTIAADAVLNDNFENSGPDDHGAVFDFGFGALAVGDTQEFQMFYGAAPSEADALLSLGEVGAEVFSLGKPSSPGGETDGTPHTFIFGFAGVGGTAIGPGGGAATAPLNFAGQFANLVVDHHLYRSAQRLDKLSFGTRSTQQGADITPVGLEGVTIRLTGSYFDGDFNATTNNVGIDYDSNYLAASIEREFDVSGGTFSLGMVGFSFGYEDVSASRKDGLGSFNLKGLSYAVYGGVANPNGAFLDGALFYTDLDYGQRRTGITEAFSSSPQGDSFGGRVRAGYNFNLGEFSGFGAGPQFTQNFGVYAEWTHRNTSISSFTENNRGLTTAGFSDESNEIGGGVRYGFKGFGPSNNIFGNIDVALLTDVSGDDFSVTQTTFGGTALTRMVDGDDSPILRSSVEVGFADVSGWSGAARVGSRISDDHSEVEVGLEVSLSF